MTDNKYYGNDALFYQICRNPDNILYSFKRHCRLDEKYFDRHLIILRDGTVRCNDLVDTLRPNDFSSIISEIQNSKIYELQPLQYSTDNFYYIIFVNVPNKPPKEIRIETDRDPLYNLNRKINNIIAFKYL